MPAKAAKAEAAVPMRKWPADSVEQWPVSKIKEYAKNTLIHTDTQVQLIAESMKKFGVTTPVLVDEDGVLIYGHGRRRAAEMLGYDVLPVCVARGWSEEDKKAYRIADNQLGRVSEWDMPLLRTEISELKAMDFDLTVLGFPQLQLVEFTTGFGKPGGGDGADEQNPDDAERGTLLELVDITIAEPKHVLERGDHYMLSEKHHLFCTGVIADWAQWAPLLNGDALFCPYPGVFVPFGSKAKKHTLVLVQPDPYIAGHILDRWVDANGEKAIAKVTP